MLGSLTIICFNQVWSLIFLPAIIQVIYAVANDGLQLEIPECPFGKLIAGLFLSNLEVLSLLFGVL